MTKAEQREAAQVLRLVVEQIDERGGCSGVVSGAVGLGRYWCSILMLRPDRRRLIRR
jgi:hypothetical protein